MITHLELRKKFLDFFASKEHLILEGMSLVPINDTSLLWINSGVATLKKYFSGIETPPCKRLTSSQRSIRTNDIENVGFTSRHHTLFEMLGNFSIGDYFKVEALEWAWEFLTSKRWIGLDKNKLYITVFEEDHEAIRIWKEKIKVTEEHIIYGTRKTNFWDMGQGPCGPNTEIYFDRGEKFDPNKLGIKLLKEDIENDRYIEIWNVVFSEFNNDGKNNYQPLPQKNIDTGMGLERILAILQNAPTNFETDLFMPIIHEIEKYAKVNYENAKGKELATYRIIADHIRAIAFAVADGALPSNKSRGYIVRRLIRRSISMFKKYLAQDLNQNCLLSLLVEPFIILMKPAYPFLQIKKDIILDCLKQEEEKFAQAMTKALNEFEKAKQNWNMKIAFKMYDTYGMPIELLKEWALEANLKFIDSEFEKCMEEHVELSRKNQNFGLAMDEQNDLVEDIKKLSNQYIGEQHAFCDAKIIYMFENNEKLTYAQEDENVVIIFDITPFYAESGGQIYDIGEVKSKDGENIGEIYNVQKGPNNTHLHYAKIIKGTFKCGDVVRLEYSKELKKRIAANHSVTHLAHEVICDLLNEKVPQSGSYLDGNRLRFDFTTQKKIDHIFINKLIEKTNNIIHQNLKLKIEEMSLDVAKKLNIHMNFEDRYGSVVRVVKFDDYSQQLCGGSHVKQTKDIEQFDITNYKLVAANTYRIEAITGKEIIANYYTELNAKINETWSTLKKDIESLIEKNKIQKNADLVKCMDQIKDASSYEEVTKKRENIATLNKLYKDYLKEQEFKLVNWYISSIMNYIINDLDNEPIKNKYVDDKLIIVETNILENTLLRQAFEKVIEYYQKKLVILFNKNNFVVVGDKNNKNANNHLKTIFTNFGGKGGGSNMIAQGTTEQNLNILKLREVFNRV
ncbi:hypothetical protein ASO20_00460 [Mycoplasma sp. (ex Biomphalaria glabrata)]|uniref:alanine--tRNA ligase n=1 Tax=Mycoplasma sp. (ex Biomphalaria glabrata) TaxID=1749074 RepID=UPI00073A84B5|nr:alanine--tRNA ligase [Mycoplasma sp. (ex Biomphalaria glabrata)]ALV23152.1 hypothetical protein ASO20_00460 [Mycoplasma sp. (ex Biomphalaria glabrata)]